VGDAAVILTTTMTFRVGVADIAILKITIANDCVVRMVVNDI
jgi:hypothetical protein